MVSSLVKGLRLLTAVLDDQGRNSLTSIAAQVGIPLPTAHRMVLDLEAEGYLLRVRKGYFLPGHVMQGEVCNSGESAPQLAVLLRGQLFRLARDTRAFAHFGVLEEGMVTYLVKERGIDADLFTEERMQLEAYCSAIGKVLLAALPDADLDAYLACGPFVALTPQTLVWPQTIRAEIEAVRTTGVGYDRREIREDLYCIAVPVRSEDSRVVGAISLSMVGYVPNPEERRRIVRKLRAITSRPLQPAV